MAHCDGSAAGRRQVAAWIRARRTRGPGGGGQRKQGARAAAAWVIPGLIKRPPSTCFPSPMKTRARIGARAQGHGAIRLASPQAAFYGAWRPISSPKAAPPRAPSLPRRRAPAERQATNRGRSNIDLYSTGVAAGDTIRAARGKKLGARPLQCRHAAAAMTGRGQQRRTQPFVPGRLVERADETRGFAGRTACGLRWAAVGHESEAAFHCCASGLAPARVNASAES